VTAAHVVVASVDAPVLEPDDAHHLLRVLRLRPGSLVSVTDGRGGVVACELSPAGLSVVGPVSFVPRPAPPLTVAFAPVKGDRPEWAVQKLTELGVDRIVLLETDRGVVRWPAERAASHVARLRTVARQAVMQSRRCWLPSVEGVLGLGDLTGPVAIAAPFGRPPSLDWPTVLVGPEGGWSDDELAADLPRMALGEAVLRTETAAVAAGVLLTGLRAGLVGPAPASPAPGSPGPAPAPGSPESEVR
jgi:16S rRNA (uracil1498-N3)-methyltransferase